MIGPRHYPSRYPERRLLSGTVMRSNSPEASPVTDERDYDVKRPLRDVIGTLLELVLLPSNVT